MASFVATVRAAAQRELRRRVAGEDAAAHHAEIWDAPGPRRFGPDDPIWRVHADAALFVGGLRALLLQSMHPVAMQAVDEHSGYRDDPWGRLSRTAHFVAATTYGNEAVAAAAVERVRRVHTHVRGRMPDGREYRADDPHLLAWVHLAEVDSFLRIHQRFGAEPLTTGEADTYVAQSAEIAVRLGVIDPPATRAELASDLRRYRPELQATAAARRAARFLVLRPPIPLVAQPLYGALATAAVTSLPGFARRGLGLVAMPFDERLLGRPAGAMVVGALRWTMAERD